LTFQQRVNLIQIQVDLAWLSNVSVSVTSKFEPVTGLNDREISKTLSEASGYNAVLSMNVTLVTFAALSISGYTAAPPFSRRTINHSIQ